MNFLDNFEAWLVKSGKKKKVAGKQVYAGSLSKGSAQNYMMLVRKMFIELGYVKKVGYKTYSVESGKNWRKVTVAEIDDYMTRTFPPGSRMSPKEKNRRFIYGIAIKKFAEYMTFGTGHWSEEKFANVYTLCSYTMVRYEDLVIEPPYKAHAFCDWLWKENIGLALPMFLGQWLGGMRYSEVQQAKLNLKEGSLVMNWNMKRATITGKGQEGKTKPVVFDDLVAHRLKEYLAWRTDLDCDSDSLAVRESFRSDRAGVKPDGYRPLPKQASDYNTRIRKMAQVYNVQMKKEGKDRLVLDLELVTSHKLGRHVFGTYFAKSMEQKMLKENMRIKDDVVVERYINFDWSDKHEAYSSVTASYLNGSGTPQKEGNELADLLSKIPPEKQEAVKELLKALVS
ncbi:MAG: site-specific integrase [Thermoplasmata archaeon]|nr:site-specific integrase [Thermoplasmata archaeon]